MNALVFVWILAGWPGGVFQDKPAEGVAKEPPAPDPAQIVQQAFEAARKVTSGTYEAHLVGLGELKTKHPEVWGKVTFQALPSEDPSSMGAKLALEGGFGPDGKKGPFHARYDGKTYYFHYDEEDAAIRIDSSVDKSVYRRAEVRMFLSDLALDEPFAQARNASVLRYEGVKDVEGVACHVIYLEYEKPDSQSRPSDVLGRRALRSRWYFAVEDHLPRRVDIYAIQLAGLTGPKAQSGAALVIKNLVVNPKIDPAVFVPPPLKPSSGAQAPAATDSTQTPKPSDGDSDDGDTTDAGRKGKKDKKKKDKPHKPRIDVGDAAPDFELKDAAGKTHKLSDFKGKVVLLDFWATWCKPCIMAMPALEGLHEKYKDKGVVVVGLNVFDDLTRAKKFLKEKGGQYLNLLEANAVASNYKANSLPTFVIIDQAGRVAFRTSGYGGDLGKQLAGRINELLKTVKTGGSD